MSDLHLSVDIHNPPLPIIEDYRTSPHLVGDGFVTLDIVAGNQRVNVFFKTRDALLAWLGTATADVLALDSELADA